MTTEGRGRPRPDPTQSHKTRLNGAPSGCPRLDDYDIGTCPGSRPKNGREPGAPRLHPMQLVSGGEASDAVLTSLNRVLCDWGVSMLMSIPDLSKVHLSQTRSDRQRCSSRALPPETVLHRKRSPSHHLQLLRRRCRAILRNLVPVFTSVPRRPPAKPRSPTPYTRRGKLNRTERDLPRRPLRTRRAKRCFRTFILIGPKALLAVVLLPRVHT